MTVQMLLRWLPDHRWPKSLKTALRGVVRDQIGCSHLDHISYHQRAEVTETVMIHRLPVDFAYAVRVSVPAIAARPVLHCLLFSSRTDALRSFEIYTRRISGRSATASNALWLLVR